MLNTRGLPLHPVDIIKSSLLEKIDDDLRSRLAHIWDEVERGIGRSEFLDMFSHVRMIMDKGRTKESLERDILRKLDNEEKIENFIKNELSKFAEAYEFVHESSRESVRASIVMMQRVKKSDWYPIAMYFKMHIEDQRTLERAFVALRNLVIVLNVTGLSEGRRAGRYGNILRELERQGDTIEISRELVPSLYADDLEKKNLLEILSTDCYSIASHRHAVLWFCQLFESEN